LSGRDLYSFPGGAAMHENSLLAKLRVPMMMAVLLACPAFVPSAAGGQQGPPTVKIDLEQAVQLALEHNHTLKAARTTIQQSQAEEITAAIRPNPAFIYDDLFVPITPGEFTAANFNNITEFDVGASYTIERGHKRQARVRAARDTTLVTRSQVTDTDRGLTFNVAQQFINVLLAKSNLEFAQADLASFQQTVDVSEARYKAGNISENDFLRIKLQLLTFQTDVSSAQLALTQALASLRQLIGYDALPANYDVEGDLAYSALPLNKEDLLAIALKLRPDLRAAEQGVTAAESQHLLAKANGKRNLTTSLLYTHVSALNSTSFSLNTDIPVFDRNQGEIARTRYAVTQSQETKTATEETVMTDVTNAYEGLKTNEQVLQLYQSGYLKSAQDSRDISEYAYTRGAASLLDFLDAQRSYRATQLAYRQALANYMLSLEQLREAVGKRNLP
jgi:cobalt-zinc-cadmium efflux system outer membrane protein